MPREIEIWFTHREGHFYVIAEYATSNWVQNLIEYPEVQVKVAENSFKARARVIPSEAISVGECSNFPVTNMVGATD